MYPDQQRRYIDQIWKLFAVGDALFAGVSEAGLFRSDDRGESWRPVLGMNEHPSRAAWVPGAGGLGLHSILVDRQRPERMWVGISAAGVFRSDDGGETWERKNDGVAGDTIEEGDPGWEDLPTGVTKIEAFCVHGLAHDPDNADVIYRQDHQGMYITRDGGDHWESIEGGLPVVELSNGRRCVFGFAVVLDTHSETVLSVPLAGDSFRYPVDGELRVYRTHVGDESWEPTAEGLPDAYYSNILRGAISLGRPRSVRGVLRDDRRRCVREPRRRSVLASTARAAAPRALGRRLRTLMAEAPVTVQLPAVLAQMVEGQRLFEVHGSTIGEALGDLVSQRPGLRVHLFDESGGLRPHVLCFHNEEYARGIEGLNWSVAPGDRLTILNSVAGGTG